MDFRLLVTLMCTYYLFYFFIKLLSVNLSPQLTQTPSTQTIIELLRNIIPMTLLQLHRLTLAINDIVGFAFEARFAFRASFDFVFSHFCFYN